MSNTIQFTFMCIALFIMHMVSKQLYRKYMCDLLPEVAVSKLCISEMCIYVQIPLLANNIFILSMY